MLDCKILTTEAEVSALADEWKQLYASIGKNPFTDYGVFDSCHRHVAKVGGKTPLVVTGRIDGKLVALLHFTIRRKRGLRILQGPGVESMHLFDVISASDQHAQALWDALKKSGAYDILIIRNVEEDSVSERHLASLGWRTRVEPAIYLTNMWANSAEWLATLSNHNRKQYNYQWRQLAKKGEAKFTAVISQPIPFAVIDQMLEQKKAWTEARHVYGIFNHSGVKPYYHDMSTSGVDNGRLCFGYISVGDQVIASAYGLSNKRMLFVKTLSNDQNWGQHSPGVLMMTEMIKWGIDHGCSEVNMGIGLLPYKLRFSKAVRNYNEWVHGVTLKGKLVALLYITVLAGKGFVTKLKASLKKLNSKQKESSPAEAADKS